MVLVGGGRCGAAACTFVYLRLCPSSRRVHQQNVRPGSATSPWTPTSAVKERQLAVAAALWTHFYPFVRSVRLSQTPPELLADAAAGQQHQVREMGMKKRGQRLVSLLQEGFD